MVAQEQISTLYDSDVYGRDGNKIGSVGQVWGDPGGQPSWISVKTGLFGLNESLVPLQNAELRSDRLVVPFDKDTVKDAPNVDASADEPLEQDDVARLYQYYGLSWNDGDRTADGTGDYTTGAADGTGDYPRTTDNRTTDNRTADARTADTGRRTDDNAMTRSEERLNVGTEREQVGRARLRKYVVTEQQQVNVPVQREEVRLDREPITDTNRDSAVAGPDLTESEHEVTLHAERPVVDTETVPVERVRLGKETVTDEQTVGGDVRKERIEADLPGEDDRRTLG
jgi:uncharacterized protein (TIGR02271 family)